MRRLKCFIDHIYNSQILVYIQRYRLVLAVIMTGGLLGIGYFLSYPIIFAYPNTQIYNLYFHHITNPVSSISPTITISPTPTPTDIYSPNLVPDLAKYYSQDLGTYDNKMSDYPTSSYKTYTDDINMVTIKYPPTIIPSQITYNGNVIIEFQLISASDPTTYDASSLGYVIQKNYTSISSFIQYLSTIKGDVSGDEVNALTDDGNVTYGSNTYRHAELTFDNEDGEDDYIFMTKNDKVAVISFAIALQPKTLTDPITFLENISY